jgi:hypothetical protein
MGKRIVMAFVWILVLYFGACIATGAVVGFAVAMQNPRNPSAAATRAATDVAKHVVGFYFVGALVIGGGGSLAGLMPGTRSR